MVTACGCSEGRRWLRSWQTRRPGRRERLATALRGAAAVVGVTVPVDRLLSSVGLAQLAAELGEARMLSDDPLFVDEHLAALLVHRDEALLTVLRHQHLASLAALPGSTRDRLSATLRSWLMNMGNRTARADELHVHPQTVRYRLGRLRELFRSALDDPAIRAALLLAPAWGPAATANNPQARHDGSENLPLTKTIDRSRVTTPLATATHPDFQKSRPSVRSGPFVIDG